MSPLKCLCPVGDLVPHLMKGFLRSTRVCRCTASRSVQPFCTVHLCTHYTLRATVRRVQERAAASTNCVKAMRPKTQRVCPIRFFPLVRHFELTLRQGPLLEERNILQDTSDICAGISQSTHHDTK